MHVHVHQSKIILNIWNKCLIVFGATSIDMIPQTITSDIWLILVFREDSSPMFLFTSLCS